MMSQHMQENFCELCIARGQKSRLISYQINFDEAIWLCESKDCQFPVGCRQLFPRFVVQRSSSEMANWKKKKKPRATKYELQSINNPQVPTKEEPAEFFVQWQNRDSLCWLHSVLSMLVHNNTLRSLLKQTSTLPQSLLGTLRDKYDSAQEQYVSSQELAGRTLKEVQQLVWNYLAPKMKCSLGKDDSPIAALPLLLRENETVSDHYTQEIKWEFNCTICGYLQTTSVKKILLTFPNTPDDFCMPHGAFVRPCYQCDTPGQKMTLSYDRMPDCILVHFVEGLKLSSFLDAKFSGADGRPYAATQFIQYSKNPNHFSCWTKEIQGSRWLEMDDLKSAKCRWILESPKVPPSEVHVVVWEKVPSGKQSSSSTTAVSAVNSTTLMDISNCDLDKPRPALTKSCHGDNYKSISKTGQSFVTLDGDKTRRSFPKDTTLAEPMPLTGHSGSSAKSQRQGSVKSSDLHSPLVLNSPNGTALSNRTTNSCKTSFTVCANSSAEFPKRKSAENLDFSLTMSDGRHGMAESASPSCKASWNGPACSRFGVESHKRKDTKFAPYIPRKQRVVTQSCPSSPLSREPRLELTAGKVVRVAWLDGQKTDEVMWLDGQKSDVVSFDGEFRVRDDKSVSDSASESGYSSNSSTPDPVSLSEVLSPDGHTAIGNAQLDGDLAAELEELLPDSLLDSLDKRPPVDLETSLKELSAEQDQFLLDLLAT